jgi:preprotein translocase subunit SecD
MRWTCVLIGFLFLTFLPARAGHSPPKIVLRVHVQTTGEGQSAQEVTTITVPPNGEQIQVRTLPELTEQELVGVQQDASGGVRLQFNHVGQVNLSAVTAQNQGRILVVLIDGYVVYAPIIDEQITSGELDIPRQISLQIVQLLQEVAQQNVKQAART